MSALRRFAPVAMAALVSGSVIPAAWAQAPAARLPPPLPAASPTETVPSPAPDEADGPPAPAPSPSPPEVRLPPPMSGPRVRLQTNNARARLQEQLQLSWSDVCGAPCGRTVDPNGTYRLAGGTLRPTDPFRMPRPAGVVLVQGNMGSNVKHWVGLGFALGGALDALTGAIVLADASTKTGQYSSDLSNKDFYSAIGVYNLIIGAILLGVGIGLAVSGTSSVEVQ